MRFLQQDDRLFAGLSPEARVKYPDIQVCPLKAKDEKAPGETIFVEEGLEPSQVLYEVISNKLQNLVQKNDGRFEQNLLALGKLLSRREDYFSSRYCFLDEEPEKELLIPFQVPKDKDQLKIQALDFFEKISKGSLVAAGDAVIEELYMNAMVDAPLEAQKKGIQLKESSSELYICQAKNGLQISCSDPYGSLDIQKCLTRMNEVYQKGVGQSINFEKTGLGAGIGCVILFEQSASLILGVRPGAITKVTCILPLGIGNRVRTEMKKSLHWFEL